MGAAKTERVGDREGCNAARMSSPHHACVGCGRMFTGSEDGSVKVSRRAACQQLCGSWSHRARANPLSI